MYSAKLIIPIALLALVAGCKQDTQPHGKGMPPSAVTVVTAEAKEVPVTYEHTAQTAGYREVEVRGRVTGLLLRRNYKEGAPVRKGETMFTIDPAPFDVASARAEATSKGAGKKRISGSRSRASSRPAATSRD